MRSLFDAVGTVPAGKWAVGVSGGADSVALLRLLRDRPDLSLHVVHLDHQTRREASTEDSRFVAQLAAKFELPCTLARRLELEPDIAKLPENPSARYRAVRLELFRRVVGDHQMQGVILAHHRQDQAETVLQRLIRGSGPSGLKGMARKARIGSLVVLRPLLDVQPRQLRDYLRSIGQDWREDLSNQSDQYLRNRLRKFLRDRSELGEALVRVGEGCRALQDWASRAAPRLPESFEVLMLQGVPKLLAHQAARRWLIERGAEAGELGDCVVQRLCEMATDMAFPSRQAFPGGLLVRRRGGMISAVQR